MNLVFFFFAFPLDEKCECWFQEAKQALELMGKWETIDVSDALELLSPVFESEEVNHVTCLHFTAVLFMLL